MKIKEFINNVENTNWQECEELTCFVPEKVPAALISLALVDKESNDGIYDTKGVEYDLLLNPKITNNLLSAVGNNHAGTYYPVIKKALSYIIQVSLSGNHIVARNCAVNILIDLYFFHPDDGSAELQKYVKDIIRKTIKENSKKYTELIILDYRNKSLIDTLMSIIEN